VLRLNCDDTETLDTFTNLSKGDFFLVNGANFWKDSTIKIAGHHFIHNLDIEASKFSILI